MCATVVRLHILASLYSLTRRQRI